jgi:AraC-like DNA-binding protein
MTKHFDFLRSFGQLSWYTPYIGSGVHAGRHDIERSPFSRLHLVEATPGASRQGFLKWQEGTNRELLMPGFAYFVPKGLRVELKIVPGTRMVTVLVSLEAAIGLDVFGSVDRVLVIEDTQGLGARIHKALNQSRSTSAYFDVVGSLYQLLGRFQHESGADFREAVVLESLYRPVFDLLKTQPKRRFSVSEMAEAMGMDRSVLSRRFTRDLGRSPKALLDEITARRALHLLFSTSMTLGAIAESLDFSDEYYFSRFFKKHFGHSPAQFRRMHVGLDQSMDRW